jgi:hypothetical protein
MLPIFIFLVTKYKMFFLKKNNYKKLISVGQHKKQKKDLVKSA